MSADYVFAGTAIHSDLHFTTGVPFNETFTYKDSAGNPIDNTGDIVLFEVRNIDTKAVALTGSEADIVTLGGADGTIRIQVNIGQVATLINRCYEWDIVFNTDTRFMRGYVFRDMLL